MKALLRLFNAFEIEEKKRDTNKLILEKCIKNGFMFSPEVMGNYNETQLLGLIEITKKEISLDTIQINSSFHKSWAKIETADMEQLILEQAIHYLTTYGFENLGFYNSDSVYIPNEILDITEIEIDRIKLKVIKGYTKEEIKEKLFSLLQSGIALKEDTINDIVNVSCLLELNDDDICTIKNKEVKCVLYDRLCIIPKNNVEFLRFCIYKSTEKTLLIKNKQTIESIQEKKNMNIYNLFVRYERLYGLNNLAEIFYRFKPLFLAFRANEGLRKYINKIRKLAVKYHKPMKEDYLNTVTARIKNSTLKMIDLNEELKKVNIFRKIRLAYALKYRCSDADSILYKIRNGKAYAKEFDFKANEAAELALKIVKTSIIEDLTKKVKDKKIYIPEYINYALPATEKQFTGNFPSGSCITIPKDMIIGIHWDNVKDNSIDLDLSMLNFGGKFGWDSAYRSSDKSILFSGDITDAPLPNGASELFYISSNSVEEQNYIMFVNYYNYCKEDKIEVPFKIIIAKEYVKRLNKNYMVDPNNVLSIVNTKIDVRQKILGLVSVNGKECNFYFCEASIGKSITSTQSKYVKNALSYLKSFYENTLSFNEILEKSGAEIIRIKDNCDINLSPEMLEKETIINLIKN